MFAHGACVHRPLTSFSSTLSPLRVSVDYLSFVKSMMLNGLNFWQWKGDKITLTNLKTVEQTKLPLDLNLLVHVMYLKARTGLCSFMDVRVLRKRCLTYYKSTEAMLVLGQRGCSMKTLKPGVCFDSHGLGLFIVQLRIRIRHGEMQESLGGLQVGGLDQYRNRPDESERPTWMDNI